MINRVLIRIRIIQILYSYYQNQDGNIKKTETELQFSFQKSSDLYYYLLLLMIKITDAYAGKIETAKAKLLPTEEDLNPNIRLLENRFILQLRENVRLRGYLKERPMTWQEYEPFIKSLLNDILTSDIYNNYIRLEEAGYEDDKEFWRKVFKHIIVRNAELDDLLEDESLFWNDDVEIVESFVLKTIKRFEEQNGENQALLPMFKDEEDREFAVKLLRESIFNGKEYRETVSEYAKNWESERIAFIDQIIMQVAMAELLHFPSIPVNVTLNEYIDIAKAYSTEKSSSFINGILDSIVEKLRQENRLIK